jgi:hypothetical protein
MKNTASQTCNWTFSSSNTLSEMCPESFALPSITLLDLREADLLPWSLLKQSNATVWPLKAIFTELPRGQTKISPVGNTTHINNSKYNSNIPRL